MTFNIIFNFIEARAKLFVNRKSYRIDSNTNEVRHSFSTASLTAMHYLLLRQKTFLKNLTKAKEMNFHRLQFDFNRVFEKKQFLVIEIYHVIVLNMRKNKLHYSFVISNLFKFIC